jgi:hypothetical protein
MSVGKKEKIFVVLENIYYSLLHTDRQTALLRCNQRWYTTYTYIVFHVSVMVGLSLSFSFSATLNVNIRADARALL